MPFLYYICIYSVYTEKSWFLRISGIIELQCPRITHFLYPMLHMGQSQNNKTYIKITIMITKRSYICFYVFSPFFPYLLKIIVLCLYYHIVYSLQSRIPFPLNLNSISNNIFNAQPRAYINVVLVILAV